MTVKRINVIGEDGSLRMVLSNETRQHPGRIDGKDLPARERGAGVLYFNYDGDECGGLLYGNVSKDSVINSSMSFTMDQYRQDQVIQLVNSEYIDKGKARVEKGFVINEFPVGSSLSDAMKKMEEFEAITNKKVRNEKLEQYFKVNGSKNRLFLGRNSDNKTGLFLKDSDGKTKIRIYVNNTGNAVIESADSTGKFVNIIR